MMLCRCGAVLLAILVFATPTMALEDEYAEEPRDALGELPRDFYFTQDLVKMIVGRMSDQLGNQLDMDIEQRDLTRERLEQTLSRYLVDNREGLQPVINDFMNMWAGDEAPSAENVAEWAGRAKPMLHEFSKEMLSTADSFGEFLTDDQKMVLDGHMAAFEVGTRFAGEKLQIWEEGGYDRELDWHRSPKHAEYIREEGRLRYQEEETARAIAEGREPPQFDEQGRMQPATPQRLVDSGPASAANPPVARDPAAARALQQARNRQRGDGATAVKSASDEWTRYVEDFIRRYQLNDGQTNKARDFLRVAQEQRSRWESTYSGRVTKLEKLATSARTDGGKATAKAQLERLRAPLERYFTMLKSKLQKLPTRKQRAAALQRTPEKAETARE